jgi:DNA-directed RNA polymerase specialized sigma24 family protein
MGWWTMAHGRRKEPPSWDFNYWKPLVESAARAWRTTDPDELKAVLIHRVYVVLNDPKRRPRNWTAYIRKTLRTTASNWIRSQTKTEDLFTSLDKPLSDTSTLGEVIRAGPDASDELVALKRVLARLKPELKSLYAALVQEGWRLVGAATRLGIHRNTARTRLHRLQRAFARQGLSLKVRGSDRRQTARGKSQPTSAIRSIRRGAFISLRTTLVLALTTLRLSGTQMRILFWVMLETSRQKQRAVPLSWRQIARNLGLNHVGVARAGKALVQSGLLFHEHEKFGISRDYRPT